MPVIKKQTNRKNSKARKPVKVDKKAFEEVVFFPEKLAKVNALLDKATLFPHAK